MKTKNGLKRVVSLVLVMLMLLSLVPTAAFAAGTGEYHKIAGSDDFTTGEYVMMVDTGYAVGPMDGAWVSAVALTPDGDTVTNPATAVVEITVTGTSAKIKLSDGAFIAPKGGNNNGIEEREYDWAWTETDGKFVFSGTGERYGGFSQQQSLRQQIPGL